jgi:hypothetical protein
MHYKALCYLLIANGFTHKSPAVAKLAGKGVCCNPQLHMHGDVAATS